MTTKDMQDEFKEILLYGYRRGNEDTALSAQQLVSELTEKMKELMEKIEIHR